MIGTEGGRGGEPGGAGGRRIDPWFCDSLTKVGWIAKILCIIFWGRKDVEWSGGEERGRKGE